MKKKVVTVDFRINNGSEPLPNVLVSMAFNVGNVNELLEKADTAALDISRGNAYKEIRWNVSGNPLGHYLICGYGS